MRKKLSVFHPKSPTLISSIFVLEKRCYLAYSFDLLLKTNEPFTLVSSCNDFPRRRRNPKDRFSPPSLFPQATTVWHSPPFFYHTREGHASFLRSPSLHARPLIHYGLWVVLCSVAPLIFTLLQARIPTSPPPVPPWLLKKLSTAPRMPTPPLSRPHARFCPPPSSPAYFQSFSRQPPNPLPLGLAVTHQFRYRACWVYGWARWLPCSSSSPHLPPLPSHLPPTPLHPLSPPLTLPSSPLSPPYFTPPPPSCTSPPPSPVPTPLCSPCSSTPPSCSDRTHPSNFSRLAPPRPTCLHSSLSPYLSPAPPSRSAPHPPDTSLYHPSYPYPPYDPIRPSSLL